MPEATSNFLWLLAQGLLVVSLPILVAAAVYWLKQKGDVVKNSLGTEKLAALQAIGALAVRAAEQAGLSQQIIGGAAKKEYALQVAQDYLGSLGVKVNVKMITTVVESEVLRQFNSGAPPVDTPATRAALVDKAVEAAVLAAEQSGLRVAAANAAASLAEQKKQYALSLAQKYLEDHGLRVNMVVVDGLIEAQIMKFKIQAAQTTVVKR